MNELVKWLEDNHICYKLIDKEVIEIVDFGKMFLADLSGVRSIFRGTKDNLIFNLMENPDILIDEEVYYVAFPFGKNYYYFDLREEFRFNELKHIGKRKETHCKYDYVNLGVHSGYELLNGSGDIGKWVKKAKLMGHRAIGICDANTMAATLVLQKECAKAGLNHVFGYSFTLEHGESKVEMKMYCQSQVGLKNLLRVQKYINVDSETNTISLDELIIRGKGNVLVFGKLSSHWMKGNPHIINLLKDSFERVFYQVDLSEYKAERIDLEVLQATRFYFSNFYDYKKDAYLVEPVLIADNYYVDKDEARNKIILNKVAQGAAHKQSEDQYFKDADEHYQTVAPLFNPDMWDTEKLFKLMCDNTLYIADHATAKYELGRMYMPEYIMKVYEREKYRDRRRMFLELLEEGLRKKIHSSYHDVYRKRLEEEVYIIESTNNVDYFLVQWDMVNEARRRGITVGIGRGSAGGSLVSYLLGITSIDPIKYDLIFSRFLVPERCGLNWHEFVTIIGGDVYAKAGNKIIECTISNMCYRFYSNAEFRVNRDGEEKTVMAYQLKPNDVIIMDNRDILWTLKDIQS